MRCTYPITLPTGIFYAQGVKANVFFFDKHDSGPDHQTRQLWVYDLRTNVNFTLRTNPLRRSHLDDFVACYHLEDRHQRQESERFCAFSHEELLKRDKLNLDLFWLRDESLEGTDKLPPPSEIAASIVEDLQNALEQFLAITEDLGGKRTEILGRYIYSYQRGAFHRELGPLYLPPECACGLAFKGRHKVLLYRKGTFKEWWPALNSELRPPMLARPNSHKSNSFVTKSQC